MEIRWRWRRAPKNDGGGGGRRLAARWLGTTGLPGARVPGVVSAAGRAWMLPKAVRGDERAIGRSLSGPGAGIARYRSGPGQRMGCAFLHAVRDRPSRSGADRILSSARRVFSSRNVGADDARIDFSCSVRQPNFVVLLLFPCEFPNSLRSSGVSRDPATRTRNEGRRRACTGKPARVRRAGTWWAKASVPSPSRFRPASRGTGSARVRSRRSAGR